MCTQLESTHLQIQPGLAQIPDESERAQTGRRVVIRDALTAVLARNVTASIGHAFLCNPSKPNFEC